MQEEEEQEEQEEEEKEEEQEEEEEKEEQELWSLFTPGSSQLVTLWTTGMGGHIAIMRFFVEKRTF